MIEADRASLLHAGRSVRTWPVQHITSLTTRAAGDLTDHRGLLLIERAAPGALKVLRAAGRSFATSAGEVHLVEPPELLILQPPTQAPTLAPSPSRSLSKGAARVGRWLLLHADARDTTISELATASRTSVATASRAVAQLADRDLLRVATATDARQRAVNASDPAQLLDAIADEGPWRRARQTTWDVGARTTAHALDLIRTAASATGLPYCVGGLAGAALVEPLVEPAVATIWVRQPDLEAWQRELIAEPARPATGRITVRIAPDPVILDWATDHDGLRIADLVQLYIDCRYSGERAIDLTDAIRRRLLPTP
ncbi:hypothetical protein GKE82_24105 [Conexibacter sp. W3-3-2]|uniref:hypothetical protein n=1 Tax=Conexibacter sp. W3-3-2 TaxID=2675227 RepID=UPI0012B70B36|nr:hypothetical protein [Conexibacter sp. W3-3-2]MTD47292.1 hypothetical protein [Conexibacter sp. W3-3-2]